MKLTLNPRSFLAILYVNFYNTHKLPTNLCDYFWKVIIAIVLVPLVYPMLIINRIMCPIPYNRITQEYQNTYHMRAPSILGLVMNLLIFLIGAKLTEAIYKLKNVEHISLLKLYANGILFIISVLMLIGLALIFCLIINYLFKKIVKLFRKNNINPAINYTPKEEKPKKENLFTLSHKSFTSWKEKNCPLIEWKKQNACHD